MTHNEAYEPPPPLPVRRAVIGGIALFVVLIGLALLIRPIIFSVAPPRGDGNLGVASTGELVAGPVSRPVLLTESHALLGERDEGNRVAITIIVSALPGGGVAVVNAWSTVEACPVAIASDATTLVDCAERRWGPDGAPLEGGSQPPLQRFAARVDNGAVIADLSAPVSGPGAPS